ncbi:MAG: hypothetical protein ACOZJZ_05445 [Pseudomonadota bacterium]
MKQINRFTLAVVALAAGAGAMYYLDPQQGRRRRAEVGQKLDHWQHVARRQVQGRTADARNRLQGLWAEGRGLVRRVSERRAHALPDGDDGLEPLSLTPEPLEPARPSRHKVLPLLAVAAPVAMAVGAAMLKQRSPSVGAWLR